MKKSPLQSYQLEKNVYDSKEGALHTQKNHENGESSGPIVNCMFDPVVIVHFLSFITPDSVLRGLTVV